MIRRNEEYPDLGVEGYWSLSGEKVLYWVHMDGCSTSPAGVDQDAMNMGYSFLVGRYRLDKVTACRVVKGLMEEEWARLNEERES